MKWNERYMGPIVELKDQKLTVRIPRTDENMAAVQEQFAKQMNASKNAEPGSSYKFDFEITVRGNGTFITEMGLDQPDEIELVMVIDLPQIEIEQLLGIKGNAV